MSCEYWFDDDELQKVVTDLDEPKLDVTIVFEISQLTEGQHVLNIRTSKPYSVSILDMRGKVFWASTLMQSELKVNLSYLDAGVYHVVFKDATLSVSSKIVLQ